MDEFRECGNMMPFLRRRHAAAVLGAPCCTVAIDRVTPNLSYGHIIENDVDTSEPFNPGSIELRDFAKPTMTRSPDGAVVVRGAKKEVAKAKANAAVDSGGADKNW
jgi:hypothetical protein